METLGQILNAARTAKKLTASEAAKGTRIKIQHIQAIERDDFSSIAAPAYAKGFIKIYAEFLEIDPAPLIKEYMDNHAPKERMPLLPDEERDGDESSRDSRSPPFAWPALPKIHWDKIKSKLAAVKLPPLKIPSVPPRLLLVYSGAVILFLLLLFTTKRCGRTPDEPTQPVVVQPSIVTPAPVGDAMRHEQPLPIVDALPEPYME